MLRHKVEFVSRTPGKTGTGVQAVYSPKEVMPQVIVDKAKGILRGFGHDDVVIGVISTDEIPDGELTPVMLALTVQ